MAFLSMRRVLYIFLAIQQKFKYTQMENVDNARLKTVHSIPSDVCAYQKLATSDSSAISKQSCCTRLPSQIATHIV